MAVSVEMHHTGCVRAARAEIVAVIEHALADRRGDWRVSIVGSQANDRWEMKIAGPNGFERSYTLKARPASMNPTSSGILWRGWCRGGSLDRKFRPLLVVVLVSGTDAGALAGKMSVGGGALFPLSAFR